MCDYCWMLLFQPPPRSIVYCNYKGFIEPEMIKARPVVILSKNKHNSRLLAVIPLSTTEPNIIRNYHVEIDSQFCTDHLDGEKCWAKCDMINVVSVDRLNLLKNRDTGIRYAPIIDLKLFESIKMGVRNAHGL